MKKRSDKVEALLRFRVYYYETLKTLAQSTRHSMSFVLCHMFLFFKKRFKHDESTLLSLKHVFDSDRKVCSVKYLFHLRFNKFLQFAMKDFAFKYNFSFNYLCEFILDYFYNLRLFNQSGIKIFENYLRDHDEHNFWIVSEDYARFNLKKVKKEYK